MRSLVLAAVFLSQAPAPDSVPASGAEALPGEWEGRRIISEAGDCELAGNPERKQLVELTVRRNDDGTFTARLSSPPADPDGAFDWTGRIDGSRIQFWTEKAANCDGRAERYLLRTSGKLPELREGRAYLRLQALDPVCGCAYDARYELTRKTP